MEHRWGQRLVTTIPVRLRCLRSPDSGCRCLGVLANVSASGGLIRTEFGIRPSTTVAVETLTTAPGLRPRELQASVVRDGPGEMSVEWLDAGSTEAFEVLTEVMLRSGGSEDELPALGRVRFCALSSGPFA
jgi:hypothetical protein